MKLIIASVLFLASQAAATTMQKRSSGVLRRLLELRQGTPSVPTVPGGEGACESSCQVWEDKILPCSSVAADQIFSCMCTDEIDNDMAQCYECLIPLVAQAGSDPTFPQDAQEAIDQWEEGCADEGISVKSITVKGGGSGSTPTAGTSPTGAGTTPTSNGSPGATTSPNSASSIITSPASLLVGTLSGLVFLLGL